MTELNYQNFLKPNEIFPLRVQLFENSMLVWILLASFTIYAQSNNNCLISLTTTQCSQCAQGYYLTTNYMCLSCPTGCSQCNGPSNCLNCQNNYYLNQATCLAATSNCLIVSPQGQCTQCILGYYLNQAVCTPCANFCIICNNGICSTCSNGFGINSTSGSCYPCGGSCTSCYYNQNSIASVCQSCSIGYYGSGSTCLQCPTSCKACSGPQACTTCSQGYYLDQQSQNSLCQSCPSNCVSCVSISQCSSCSHGYYLSNSECLSCGSSCSICTGANECTTCSGSYYNNGGLCQLCPQPCSQCTSPSFCTSCSSTSYAISAGNCLMCSELIQGCLTCSSLLLCLNCQEDYNLIEGSCFQIQNSLGAGYIVLIVLGSLAISCGIGYAIYAFWHKRRGFMGPQTSGAGSGLRATYYQIP